MIRVLIVAESEMVRRGLESILIDAPSIEVVAWVSSVADLRREVQNSVPDVVVVAGQSSADPWLRDWSLSVDETAASPAVVILSSDPAAGSLRDHNRFAVTALLPLDATSEQVRASVNAVAEGLTVVHPAMIAPETEGLALRHRDGAAPQLTGREREILAMLADGLGNKEIAWRLKI
ncbi:MAG: response regulator transcription factor, partial [Terriglobia bacterium]